jgi:hypothetical protein
MPAPVKTKILGAGLSKPTAYSMFSWKLTKGDYPVLEALTQRIASSDVTTPGAAYHLQMNRSDVQAWLDGYVEAWRKNQPELVEALFTEDVVYRFRPYDGPGLFVEGLADLVDGWIEESNDARQWQASYRPFVVEGDHAVAIGTSHYFASDDVPEKIYHNCFLLRFAPNGRCAEFTEYYMLEQKGG